MNEREIYSKTEAGREEMRTRALQLSGALRNVLLLVDGHRSIAQLKELISGGKAPPDAIEQLREMGLIEMVGLTSRGGKTGEPAAAEAPATAPEAAAPPSPSAPAPAPVAPPGPGGFISMPLVDPPAAAAVPAGGQDADTRARFDRIYALMNEFVSDYLGLRGYFMQLKIEKCANAEELLALQPELGAALAKSQGKDVAAELMSRLAAAAAA